MLKYWCNYVNEDEDVFVIKSVNRVILI